MSFTGIWYILYPEVFTIIKEAKRCLATNGYLLIVETTKSMKGRLSKLNEVIEQYGFEIYNQEVKCSLN